MEGGRRTGRMAGVVMHAGRVPENRPLTRRQPGPNEDRPQNLSVAFPEPPLAAVPIAVIRPQSADEIQRTRCDSWAYPFTRRIADNGKFVEAATGFGRMPSKSADRFNVWLTC